MARIKVMKDAKKESQHPKLTEAYLDKNYDFSSVNPSPISSKNMKLPTVNEQDEINHRKLMRHKRAHSSSSNLKNTERK